MDTTSTVQHYHTWLSAMAESSEASMGAGLKTCRTMEVSNFAKCPP